MSRAKDGGQLRGVIEQIARLFARLRRPESTQETVVDQSAFSAVTPIGGATDAVVDVEELEEGQPGGGLADLLARRPIVIVLGALITLTIIAVWVFPSTVTPPAPVPSSIAVVDASPTDEPTDQTPVATLTSESPAPTTSILQPPSTPIAVVPAVPSPTLPAGVSLGNVPTPPPPPTNTGNQNQGPRSDTPPIGSRTAVTAATPFGATSALSTPAPIATASNTPIPTATSSPTITPTPGPMTMKITIPALQPESGYYYVVLARTGTIEALWQIGGGTGQLFLLQGTPFGGGPGLVTSQPSVGLAEGNVSSKVSAIEPPVSIPAGPYTLVYYYTGVNAIGATSGSAIYTPQLITAPTVAASTTPTSPRGLSPTPVGTLSGATPTPTSVATGSGATPTADLTPSSTRTATNTPAVPTATTATGYP